MDKLIPATNTMTLISLRKLLTGQCKKNFFYYNGMPADFPTGLSNGPYALVELIKYGAVYIYKITAVQPTGVPIRMDGYATGENIGIWSAKY